MKDLFENIKKLLSAGKDKLLSNNTGYSIKSWFLYGTALAGIYLLFVVGFVLIWDVVKDGKIDTVISMPDIIDSVAGLFLAAGLPKIAGEVKEGVEVVVNKLAKKNDKTGTNKVSDKTSE